MPSKLAIERASKRIWLAAVGTSQEMIDKMYPMEINAEIAPGINITKDGIHVQVGQVWRDLDKRSNGRTRIVLEVKDGKATLDGPVKSKVSVRRMHKHHNGWELVERPSI